MSVVEQKNVESQENESLKTKKVINEETKNDDSIKKKSKKRTLDEYKNENNDAKNVETPTV